MHKFIEQYCKKIVPVGSRITCKPAPTNTDQDYLILAESVSVANDLFNVLFRAGYELGGSRPYAEDACNQYTGFSSFKKGDVNYIITTCGEFFMDFIRASDIAKKLNLLDKQQRIDLFQIVLYENFGEHEFVENL